MKSRRLKKDNSKISSTVIATYPLPREYQRTSEPYEFILVEENGRIFLKDQGKTVKALDRMFELNERDVVKNLLAALKHYEVYKKGRELFVEITPWNGVTDERKNPILNKAIFTLFACVSFMEDMSIFYV